MNNRRAEMFNRKASDPKSKPDEIIKVLNLQPGQVVADIGSGGGFFSLRFAEALGKRGMVYAVDTNPELLEYVKASAEEKGLNNIKAVLSSGGDIGLPEKSLDLVFTRNVFHHLRDRAEYFSGLIPALKPDGRVVVIDHKAVGFGFVRLFRHYTHKEDIIKVMGEAGFRLMEEHDFLPKQSFTIFSLDR